jgi:hypothetical protein
MHMITGTLTKWWYHLIGNTALADTGGKGGASFNSSGITNLTSYIEGGIIAVGVIFVLIGAISIITVIKSGEQNPDAVTGAIKNIIIGGLCCIIGTVVGWLTQ